MRTLVVWMGFAFTLWGCGSYIVSYQEDFFLPTHQIQATYFQEKDCYLGTEQYFLHYRLESSGWVLQKMLPLPGCRVITASPNGGLWIGTSRNLFEYREQKLAPVFSSEIPISKLFLFETKSFFISGKTLFHLIPNAGKYEMKEVSPFSGKPIEVLKENNDYYLVTEDAIYEILAQDSLKELYSFPEEVQTTELTCALLQNGIFWIGTHQGLFSITTNFIQLKSWGLKSQILAVTHIYSTIFCSTVDGLFRYTVVGYWEKFPWIEFSAPKHLESATQLLFLGQETPQSIYFLSAHYGIVKLTLNNYQYLFEYFRPLLPELQGRAMSCHEERLYTQRGFIDLLAVPYRFQVNPFEEDVVRVLPIGKDVLLVTQQGIQKTDGASLWETPERYFVQEVGVPSQKKSGTLLSLTLGGFPEVSPAKSAVFSCTNSLEVQLEATIQVGPVRGISSDENKQQGCLLTEADIYSFDWKRLPKILPLGKSTIRGPFLAGLETTNGFYVATPEGLFHFEPERENLTRIFPFQFGNIPVTFLQDTMKSWCISSAGEIFLWEQGHWSFLEKYSPQTSGLVSFFCAQNILYVHEAQADQIYFWEDSRRQEIQLPIPCSQIYFLGSAFQKLWIETTEAFFSYHDKNWQILYLRDIPSLDDKLFSSLK